MMTLKIRKFAYLKVPVYTWSLENEVGGSFSNSTGITKITLDKIADLC